MKKRHFLMLAAAILAISCQKDPADSVQKTETLSIDVPELSISGYNAIPDGTQFAVYLTLEGQTAPAATKATITAGTMQIALSEAVEEGTKYEVLAVSPYAQNDDPASYGVTIDGSAAVLFGKASGVAGSEAKIEFNTLSTFVKVLVTNNSSKDLTVSELKLSAQENLAGSFSFDATAAAPELVAASASKEVSCSPAITVAPGKAEEIVLALKPFAAETVVVEINGKAQHIFWDDVFLPGKLSELEYIAEDTKVYLCGDALDCGWNFSEDFTMTLVEEGVYTWTGDIATGGPHDGGKYLFAAVNTTWEAGSFICPVADGNYVLSFAECTGVLNFNETAESKKNWKFVISGNYTITLDLNAATFTVKLNSITESDAINDVTSVDIRGDFNGWNPSEGYILSVSASDANVWEAEVKLVKDNGFAIVVNGSIWCQCMPSAGDTYIPEEGMKDNIYSHQGGGVWRSSIDATYKISFNIKTRLVSFEKVQ